MTMPPRNNCKERSSPERQRKPPESQTQHIYSLSSSPPMKPLVFPPGFKFTDEDLIFHYLKPFLEGNRNPYPNVPIHRVNIYESNPEQLSKKYEEGNEKEWFFITERTKIREGSKMWNRCDNGGSWRSKNVPKKIEAGQGVVGYKTVLHYRKKLNVVKSDWMMQEYWCESSDDNNVDHALCKIFLRPRKVQKRKAEEEENERRKKKMKEEGVAEVDQPCNAAFQQPQFSLPPVDPFQPHQSQLQQQQLHNVATVVNVKEEEVDQPCNAVFQQPQFYQPCQTHQSLIRKQLHNVATMIDVKTLVDEVNQPCNAAFEQPQFYQPPLDPCQQSQLQQPQNYAYQPQQQLHNVPI